MREVGTVTLDELRTIADENGKNYVKAVVDVERGAVVVGMKFHDQAIPLLEEGGSKRPNLWGVRLHPEAFGDANFVEFDSMINIKPELDNPSTDVESPELRQRIIETVEAVVTDSEA